MASLTAIPKFIIIMFIQEQTTWGKIIYYIIFIVKFIARARDCVAAKEECFERKFLVLIEK